MDPPRRLGLECDCTPLRRSAKTLVAAKEFNSDCHNTRTILLTVCPNLNNNQEKHHVNLEACKQKGVHQASFLPWLLLSLLSYTRTTRIM